MNSFKRKLRVLILGMVCFFLIHFSWFKQSDECTNSKKTNLSFQLPNSSLGVRKKILTRVHSTGSSASNSVKKAENSQQRESVLSYSTSTFSNQLIKDIYEPGHLIINPHLCPDLGNHLKIMILVLSAPNHHNARMAIRKTWGFFQRHHAIGIGFVIGVSSSQSLNSAIEAEQYTYGDLIQTHSLDAYENVTLKTISLLEWVDTYCSRAPYILKCDDDMFINIPLLLKLLVKQQSAKRTIFGHLAHHELPFRNVSSKYFLTKTEYEANILPDFISGPAYLVTQDSVHDLYEQALKMTFFKLEDVFITGFVASRASIGLVNLNELVKRKNLYDICRMREIVGMHDLGPYEQFICWAKLHNIQKQCRNVLSVQ